VSKVVMGIMGVVLAYFSISLLVPTAFSVYYGEDPIPFFIPFVVCGLASIPLVRYGVHEKIRHSEAILVVSVAWITFSLLSAVPYILSGIPVVDSIFEAASGLTTTGATIMEDIESHALSLLLWRSMTQWLGGMGIIMLFIAILPELGVGGRELFKREFTGPTKEYIRPKIRETARVLFFVYFIFTAIMVALLYVKLSFYDALTVAFSTVSTGGFSPYTESISYFNSVYVETVVMIFMVLCGVSFALHYQALYEHPRNYLKSSELRFYLGFLVFSILVSVAYLYMDGFQILDAIRFGAFQVISITTTTGFTTYNYDEWAPVIKLLLMFGMIFGGCAGSTGGGVKMVRVQLLMKFVYQSLFRLIHPRAYKPIMFDGKAVNERVVVSILGFISLFILVVLLSTFALTLMGIHVVDALSATVSTLTNTGPGFGMVGPEFSYAPLPPLAKLILVFDMVAGRLELMVLLVLFVPEFWREVR